jgi:hypothetical protein
VLACGSVLTRSSRRIAALRHASPAPGGNNRTTHVSGGWVESGGATFGPSSAAAAPTEKTARRGAHRQALVARERANIDHPPASSSVDRPKSFILF